MKTFPILIYYRITLPFNAVSRHSSIASMHLNSRITFDRNINSCSNASQRRNQEKQKYWLNFTDYLLMSSRSFQMFGSKANDRRKVIYKEAMDGQWTILFISTLPSAKENSPSIQMIIWESLTIAMQQHWQVKDDLRQGSGFISLWKSFFEFVKFAHLRSQVLRRLEKKFCMHQIRINLSYRFVRLRKNLD